MLKIVVTSVLEIIGLLLIIGGIYLAFGLAVALIAAGVLALAASFLITTRGGRK